MRAKKILGCYVAGVFAFLYLPLLVMVVFSFNDSARNVVWKGFTLKWYLSLFKNPEILSALGTSLKVGAAATTITTFLGLFASYVLAYHKKVKGRAVYDGALQIPLMVPEIVLGVGLLAFFTRIRFPLSFWSLVCAHVIYSLPFVIGAVKARLLSLSNTSLEEAAQDLGATEWEAFWKVTFPLARPAILAGALLAFTTSFEDFVTSFFVAGIGNTTLPIKIYSMMKFGITPEINALATILLTLTVAFFLFQHKLTSKTDPR